MHIMQDKRIIKFFDKLVKYNVRFFPFIWVTVLVLVFIESVTFKGFIQKYLLFDLKLYVAFVIVSGFLARTTYIASFKDVSADTKMLYSLLGNINKLIFPSVVITTYVLYSLRQIGSDSILYNNSTRLYPETFIFIPLLSLFLIYIKLDKSESLFDRNFEPKKNLLNLFSYNPAQLNVLSYNPGQILTITLVPMIILWIVLNSISGSWKYFHPHLKTIVKNPFASYEWKMENQVGPIFSYYKFVNSYTDKSALILHPRQQGRWGDVSNAGFTRYFLFPRNLVSEDEAKEDKIKITHVFLIGQKNLLGREQDSWPDFKVPANKITYYPNNKTNQAIIVEGDFNPANNPYPDLWGIIEVKKGEKW